MRGTAERRRYEDEKAMGAAIARRSSAALRKAGVPKAGRYTPRGYVDRDGHAADGFIASGKPTGNRAAVVFTGFRHDDPAVVEVAAWCAAIIEQAGMHAEIIGRGRATIEVTAQEATS